MAKESLATITASNEARATITVAKEPLARSSTLGMFGSGRFGSARFGTLNTTFAKEPLLSIIPST